VRLAVDATPVVPGRKGLGVVIEGFLDEMAPHPQSRSWIIYVDSTYANEARRRWPFMAVRPVRSRPSVLWETTILPRRARRDGARLVFTGRDRTLCEPHAATVIYLFEIPDYRTRALLESGAPRLAKSVARYSLRRFRRIAGMVSHFIVSSHATGQDLEDKYGVPEDRVHVAYPGVSERFRPPVDDGARQAARDQFCQGQPYVLHFATGDPRENTRVALAGFATAVSNTKEDVALLLAGVRAGDLAALKTQAQELGLGQRTFFLGHVDAETLLAVYHGAETYLDPTLYEGFGLQLVEAMACGVPVISSNVTSVPEVVGDAGLLLDPDDEEGFAGALERVLSDEELRTQLAEKGRARAALFTWPAAAARIVELLEQFSRESDGGHEARDRFGSAR
jgi:glycosyltransferase involved in cell wall biosynthesis